MPWDLVFISLNSLTVPPYKSSIAITWSPGSNSSTQAEIDGWADKQADYAMDNMTSDIYDKAMEAFEWKKH